MVAAHPASRLVPVQFLFGASCQLSAPVRNTPAMAEALTPAEERVCELLLRGLSNKEIAGELGRATPTIKNQVASILRKHRVPSRARLQALWR